MLLPQRKHFYCAAGAVNANGFRDTNIVRLQHGRIERALGLLEAVVEARFQGLARRWIGPDTDAPAHIEEDSTQIIYPVRVVGMIVGEEDTVQGTHLRIQQLLAQVCRRIHQNGGAATLANPLDQQGSPAAAVLRVCGIARPPYGAYARHAGR